jgi:hypothetical protein
LPVAKADANTKIAFVHTVRHDTKEKTYPAYSQLITLDNSFALDLAVNKRVKYWNDIADKDLKSKGFSSTETVVVLDEVVDGTEGTVRGGQFPFASIICFQEI